MLRFLTCFDGLTHHVKKVLGLFFLCGGIGSDAKADAGRRFNLDIVPLFVSVEKNHDPMRQGGQRIEPFLRLRQAQGQGQVLRPSPSSGIGLPW